MDILSTERFAWYGIDLSKLNELFITEKIWLIILFNRIIDWFLDTVERIKEKNIQPIKFNIENEINDMANNSKYDGIWFILKNIEKTYKVYLESEMKNISFPKNIHKPSLWEDWEDLVELKQQTIIEIQNIIEEAFSKTIKKKLSANENKTIESLFSNY